MRKIFLFLFLLASAGAVPNASGQTTPTHVTGTFKTPGNQTPAQAGLKQIATIVSTAVYGSVDFQPWDMGRNAATTLLCGGVTYPAQPVHTWIKSDGTMIDGAAAAGMDLIPNAGCQPTGAVYRATIYFAPSSDGRVPAITIYQFKAIPAQPSVDWGALALAALSSTAYSYQPQSQATILDFENWSPLAQPANPSTGARVWFDSSALKLKCVTSAGADCNPAGSGGGSQHQVNAVNLTANDPVNFQNNLAITFSNPSAGNVRAGLRVAAGCTTTADGDRCYDSTGTRWRVWQGGANKFEIAASNLGANGQPCLSNADGSCTFADPIVSGPTAIGAAPSTNPVFVAGWDGTNIRAHHLLNANPAGTEYGLVTRNIPSGTQAVSIAAAVDVSDRAARLVGQVEGRAASGAAKAGNPNQIGGVFNTTQPTVTTGQAVEAQMTARGAQIVATGVDTFNVSVNAALPAGGNTIGAVTQASGPWTQNLTQWNSVALGSPSAYGTSPGAVNVPGVNAFVTNTPSVAQSGNWTARIVGNAGGVMDAAGQNAASPANELLVAGQFNTTPTTITSGNVSPLQLDASGNLKVNVIAGGGSGGTSSSFAAAFPSTGTAAGLKATASAPSYTEGNMQAFSSDLGGLLRVRCDAGCGGSGGTAIADRASFTFGTTQLTPAGGVFDDTPPSDLTTGMAGVFRLTAKRAMHINLRNVAGTEIGTSSTPVRTDPTGTTTQPVSLAAAVDVSDRAARLVGQVEGRAASGAAKAGNPNQIGGVFNTTQPTVTTGQAVEAQFTARGEMLIAKGVSGFTIDNTGFNVTGSLPTGANTIGAVTQASGPWTQNLTQANSVALGSPSAYGTSPGAVNVLGVNAFVTNTPSVAQSGNWTARIVGNAGGVMDAAGQNAASPANELLVAGQFNTTPTTITSGNVSPLQLDASGNLKVNIIAGAGSGGTAAVDNSAFTGGSTNVTPIGAIFNDSPPSITSGSVGAPRMNSSRVLLVSDREGNDLLNQIARTGPNFGSSLGGRIRAGLFGRPVTSTGDALDVNVKYPPQANDPCSGPNVINVPISTTANLVIISGSQRPWRICNVLLISTGAETISIVEGTGSTCGTGTLAVMGSTTAANGMPPPANGGWSYGNGAASVAAQAKPGNDLCLLKSGAGIIAGNMMLAK